jgi:hypothetical protein
MIEQPANLPEEINKQPEAISLYRLAFIALSVVPPLVIISSVVLSVMHQTLPSEAWLLASAALAVLGTAINGKNTTE